MSAIPIGYHSRQHNPGDHVHRDRDCRRAWEIQGCRCSCTKPRRRRCKGCFKHESTTCWPHVRELLSGIDKLSKDLRVKTFLGSLNLGCLHRKATLLRRCEKVELVEIAHEQYDYEPRIKSLTARGRELLSALETSTGRFHGWELEDPLFGI